MSAKDPNTMTSSLRRLEDGTYRVTHDEGQDTLSTTVVLALCAVADVDPADFRLYTYVDPDALDTLFSPLDAAGRERGRVEILALGYRVAIYGSGEIEIRPAEPETSDDSDRIRSGDGGK